MRRAIAAARRAFDDGPWPRTSHQDRARVLNAIADGMERRKEELRQLVIAEAGGTHPARCLPAAETLNLMRHTDELAAILGLVEILSPCPRARVLRPAVC